MFGDEYTASDSGAGILGSASTNRITTVAKPVHERSGSEVRSPVGMLRGALYEWGSIGACHNVLEVIQFG